MRPLFILLLISSACNANIFYTDKEQSVPLSLNSDRIRIFQEKILGILGLQRPDPEQARKSDEFASRFMSALFELMDNSESAQNKVDSEIGRVLDDIYKESKLADTIVSFIPEIRESDESFGSSLYKATFSVSNTNDGLISARLFVVLENAVLNNKEGTTLRVYRKSIAELVEIGHQNLSNYGQLALVSLNVTQLLGHWIENQEPVPTHQTVYLEFNGPNDTSIEIQKIKNLHCFGVGLFLDRPHEVERRVRRSLNVVELHEGEESSTVSATNASFFDNSTVSTLSRLDKLCKFLKKGSSKILNTTRTTPKDTKCGLRSLYVDFRDLGWSDWIIAPQGYYADFCSGSCGFPLDNNVLPINHAIVQTLVHILDKRRAPAAKCAPAELSEQSILFLNNQKNLVMKKYHNMRVTSCGCR